MKKSAVQMLAILLTLVLILPMVLPVKASAASSAKIHFLTLPANTLSVLVECNGRFGMIDSGEDNDSPSGTDSRYPLRPTVTMGGGFEDTVVAYLKSVGVTTDNFDFYIGTHPHSDHIGSADEVIRAFRPKRVYLQEYKDSYVTNPDALWDNLYVYDRMLQAAREVGASVIQNINASNATFVLGGGMTVQIKNYGTDYKSNPVPDANYFSLGVLLSANGNSAFVAGDINNFNGDETALRNELGHVDVLTLGHHGHYGSNTNAYITGLSPRVMIQPGNYSGIATHGLGGDKSPYETVMEMGARGTQLYATAWYAGELGAIVVNMDGSLQTNIPAGSSKIGVTGSYSVHYVNGLPVSTTCLDQWIQEGSRWWYRHGDGSYTTSNWEYIDGEWYYFDDEGWMATGWVQYKDVWYYLEPGSGAMVTGWQEIDGKTYYFNAEGAMASNQWVGDRYVGDDGAWIPDYGVAKWVQEGNRRWYRHSDGGYTRSDWELIDGKWYYFDAEGWMATGWIQYKNVWYYLEPGSGAMVTGWQEIDGKTYYFDSEGAMAAGKWVDDRYVGSDGAWIPDYGVAKWVQNGSKWRYKRTDNSYPASCWEQIDGKWYYFDAQSYRVTGWIQLKGVWYYLNPSSGAMVTGWQEIDGKTYYFNAEGAMVSNQWVGDRYVGDDGAWIPDYGVAKWIQEGNRWWYRHSDGGYTRSDWELIDGKWYYFDAEGWMATGWVQYKNVWYYLEPGSGAMVTGWRTIDGVQYYFNSDGAWVG